VVYPFFVRISRVPTYSNTRFTFKSIFTGLLPHYVTNSISIQKYLNELFDLIGVAHHYLPIFYIYIFYPAATLRCSVHCVFFFNDYSYAIQFDIITMLNLNLFFVVFQRPEYMQYFCNIFQDDPRYPSRNYLKFLFLG
jgi:hypothetical protein